MEVLGLYIPTWLLLLIFIAILIYIYLTWRYGELKALGIPHPPPRLLMGNLGMAFGKPGLFQMDIELRKKYGDVYGFYEARIPTIVVADVDIVKQIMVKDFNHFVNRRPLMLRGVMKHGLFDAMDDHWRHLRRLTSPTFSSGKLKYMSHQVNQCAEQLKENLQGKANEGRPFDIKEVCQAFTMDVIAATAFGLQLDSQKDPNNPFITYGRKWFEMIEDPLLLFTVFMPDLMAPLDKLGFSIENKAATNFFRNIVKQTLKDRKTSLHSTDHTDFLQLMIEAESFAVNSDEEVKKELKEGYLASESIRKEQGLTEEEIFAQSLLFFVAGFETTASTMHLVLYELAANPEAQNKVLEEIQDIWGHKKYLTYEDVLKLKYMEMCIEETMRLFPVAFRIDRRAHEDVTYKGIKIPKDYVVSIAVKALHYDPEVWPEPDKFDPERFTPEAKSARDPYYYMPFGVGPRMCVGMRLAQMELKMALATAIKNFQFKVSSKTKEPLVLENAGIIKAKGGVWLEAQPRQ